VDPCLTARRWVSDALDLKDRTSRWTGSPPIRPTLASRYESRPLAEWIELLFYPLSTGEQRLFHLCASRDRRSRRRPRADAADSLYLLFQLRRLDVWPVGDLGVRQGYALIWGLPNVPEPKQLEELGERFRPYRSIVARYCWAALGNPATTYTSLREKETTRSGRPKKTARAKQ
jgi:hypothetical protein